MKWCVIFTVFLSFSVSAEIAAQQEKVNLNLSKANLQTLFQEIQRQTGLYFVYNEELCNTFGEVNVNAKSLSVKQVLDDIFRDKDYRKRKKNNVKLPVRLWMRRGVLCRELGL